MNNLENSNGERWELVKSINAWTGEVTEGDELRLTFPEESLLRNSCLAGQEYLIIKSDTLINDVRACDGPD